VTANHPSVNFVTLPSVCNDWSCRHLTFGTQWYATSSTSLRLSQGALYPWTPSRPLYVGWPNFQKLPTPLYIAQNVVKAHYMLVVDMHIARSADNIISLTYKYNMSHISKLKLRMQESSSKFCRCVSSPSAFNSGTQAGNIHARSARSRRSSNDFYSKRMYVEIYDERLRRQEAGAV